MVYNRSLRLHPFGTASKISQGESNYPNRNLNGVLTTLFLQHNANILLIMSLKITSLTWSPLLLSHRFRICSNYNVKKIIMIIIIIKKKTQENLSFDFLSGLTRKKLVLFFDHIYLFRKPACLMTEKLQLKVNLPVVKTC